MLREFTSSGQLVRHPPFRYGGLPKRYRPADARTGERHHRDHGAEPYARGAAGGMASSRAARNFAAAATST